MFATETAESALSRLSRPLQASFLSQIRESPSAAASSALFAVRAQQFFEFRLEITPAVVSPFRDQLECGSREGDVSGGRDAKKSSQVAGVLWTTDVLSGEDLHRNQVSGGRDVNAELWYKLEVVRVSHNFRLDSG